MMSDKRPTPRVSQTIAETEACLWLNPGDVQLRQVVRQQELLWEIPYECAAGASLAVMHGLERHHRRAPTESQVVAAINYYRHLNAGGKDWIPAVEAGFAEVLWWQKHDALTKRVREIVISAKSNFFYEITLLPESSALKASVDELIKQISRPGTSEDELSELSRTKFLAILYYTKIKYYRGAPEYQSVDYLSDKRQLEAMLEAHYELLRQNVHILSRSLIP